MNHTTNYRLSVPLIPDPDFALSPTSPSSFFFCHPCDSGLYKENSQNVDVIQLRGEILLKSGSYAVAQKHFQHVLRLAPENKDAMRMFKGLRKVQRAKEDGNQAFKEGRNEDALEHYSEALDFEMPPDWTSVIRCNRAAVYLRLRKWKEVIEDCTAALEGKEDYCEPFISSILRFLLRSRYDSGMFIHFLPSLPFPCLLPCFLACLSTWD